MNFFKIARVAQPAAENDAAAGRLNAIVGRGQAEQSAYPMFEESLEPEGVRQRFWTPDEVASGDADARAHAGARAIAR